MGWIVWCVLVILGILMAHWMVRWLLQLDAQSQSEVLPLEDPTALQIPPQPSIFDAPSKSISLIIPAYNEAQRLPHTLDEAVAHLSERARRGSGSFTWEILVVDDGSSDNTARVAFSYVQRFSFDQVRVLRLRRNFGKGFAVKQGMMRARGRNLVMLDADGATQISDVSLLEAKLLASTTQRACPGAATTPAYAANLGMAVGSRVHQKSMSSTGAKARSWYLTILLKGLHVMGLMVAGAKVKDMQCALKLFTRDTARLLFPNQRLHRWCFDVELIYLAHRLQVPIMEVPVNWVEMPRSRNATYPGTFPMMMLELTVLGICYRFGLWKIYHMDS